MLYVICDRGIVIGHVYTIEAAKKKLADLALLNKDPAAKFQWQESPNIDDVVPDTLKTMDAVIFNEETNRPCGAVFRIVAIAENGLVVLQENAPPKGHLVVQPEKLRKIGTYKPQKKWGGGVEFKFIPDDNEV